MMTEKFVGVHPSKREMIAKAVLGPDYYSNCDKLEMHAESESEDNDPDEGVEGIPVTYVPARNTVFLSLALAWAEVLRAEAIFIGVNAIDYSGYPDCRPEFVAAFQALAGLATKQGVEGNPVAIKAPLVNLTKAKIIARGTELGVDYALTVSCYRADETGRACGHCDACRFRQQGFEQAGIVDPTRYQSI